MKISEAKAIVVAHPKQIGEFRRNRFTGLKRTIKVNAILYTGPNGQPGFSLGDGCIYGVRIESGSAMVPNMGKILAAR